MYAYKYMHKLKGYNNNEQNILAKDCKIQNARRTVGGRYAAREYPYSILSMFSLARKTSEMSHIPARATTV